MKILLFILGALFCCHVACTGSLGNVDDYTKVSPKEVGGLGNLIQDGTVAALKLAAADNVIDANAAARFQVEAVGRVAKNVRESDDVTSYFVIVRASDKLYHDVKIIVGFIIDENNISKVLTIRGYKIGSV